MILRNISIVIGRKNWLFCDTIRGALGMCATLSVIETVLTNNLNVFDEICKINIDDEEAIKRLLPYSNELPQRLKTQKHSKFEPFCVALILY